MQRRKLAIVFNTVDYCILGIPAYIFCALTGGVITTCVYIILISFKGYNLSQSMKILGSSVFGMMLGAKIFGFLTGIYRDIGLGKPITMDSLFDTGIVYYGGLIGLITTYALCLRINKSLDNNMINILAVCIPLFHSIARIGCFLSGCCYGKVYEGILSVKYTTMIGEYADINMRFPVQIVEGIFEFSIFIYLYVLLKKEERQINTLLLRYLSLYSIGRFLLEFLRGDYRRGIICGISFSQVISILVWVVLIVYYLKLYKFSKLEGEL